MDVSRFKHCRDKAVENVSRAIVGKDDIIALILTCFVCSGHVLLEDLPGTGKTMLLRAFAKTIGGSFRRVQFTPDLLPSDLTGINFYSPKTGEFEFRRGPLFANVILGDEINRATPRTQSALLEAMEERQITVDGDTRRLDEPFIVMATQNPIESYGTFPLPEAQLDRFFMRLSLGFMSHDEEKVVIVRRSTADIVDGLERVVTDEDIRFMKESYSDVFVCDDVVEYILALVGKTRADRRLTAGVSTRGAIALYKAAQVTAAFGGRGFVTPEDVQFVLPRVITHRLPGLDDDAAAGLVRRITDETPVPLEVLS